VRADPGVVVHQQGDTAWVRWEPSAAQALWRLLPIGGVRLYTWREGRCYRLGGALPAFEVPHDAEYRPLHQVLFPMAMQPLPSKLHPHAERAAAVRLALRPECRPQPTTAVLAAATEILT
jgi:hypothetical protein